MKKFLAALIFIAITALPAIAAVSKTKKTPKIWYTHDEKNNFETVIWREGAKGKPEKLNVKAYPVEDAGCNWCQINSEVFICTDDKDTAPVCIELEKGEKCLDIQRGPWRDEFWDEDENGKIDPSWPEYNYAVCIKGENYENIIFIDVIDNKDNQIKILAKISGLMNHWTDFENTYDLRIIDECRYLFTYSVPDTMRGKNLNNKTALWHGAAVLEMRRNKNGGLDTKITPICEPTDTVDYRAEYFDPETKKCVIEKRTVKSPADWSRGGKAIKKEEINVALPSSAFSALSPLSSLSLSSSATRPEKQSEKQEWWQRAIVYQIYPKSFQDTSGNGGGDIAGIINHLDYLKELGIGAVWITPFYTSPMVDNGYDIADYKAIDPYYGTMKDFENLIAEAEKRGIKIILDLVFNHTSDQHPWFLESKKDRTNPKADWYIWRDAKPDAEAHEAKGEDKQPPTNWRAIFGGSAWTWCEERGQYYLHTFAPQQPDLNWENPDVRRALYDAAKFWLDKGVGGFRIDAIVYIKKPAEFKDGKPDGMDGMINVHAMTANTNGILDFLREFRREVFDERGIVTVGEANGVSPDELKYWVGKNGIFSMLFEFSHVSLPFRTGELWCYSDKWKLTDLKKALSASQAATRDNGWYPVFFENHDQPRSVNHFFPKGVDTAKAAKAMATVLLTLRGTPFIYQGQELGMANTAWPSINDYDDISSHGQYKFALKEGFTPEQAMEFVHFFSRDNARTPMQWNDEANAGFTSKGVKPWLPVHDNYLSVNAEAEEQNPDSVLSWYKTLIKLRREHKELINGTYTELIPEDENIFAFVRKLDASQMITVVNFSTDTVKLPDELLKNINAGTLILSSINSTVEPDAALQPLEARIYKK